MVKRSTQNQPSSENNLTESQSGILSFIRRYCETSGAPPSYREIQKHFGYKAIGTVQDHVKALIKKGFLEEPGKKARGLVPKNFSWEGVKRIPIYGEIAAGHTRDSAQLELGALIIADNFAADPCFALRVVGNSMIEAGIFEGDHVIVERTSRVKTGDIVVALLNGETTVKRYLDKGEGIFLVPENREMRPIKVEQGKLEIQGRVVGLQRKL